MKTKYYQVLAAIAVAIIGALATRFSSAADTKTEAPREAVADAQSVRAAEVKRPEQDRKSVV